MKEETSGQKGNQGDPPGAKRGCMAQPDTMAAPPTLMGPPGGSKGGSGAQVLLLHPKPDQVFFEKKSRAPVKS